MDIQNRIRSAFLDLAEEEPNLQKVTTTQVLNRAGVSRSTFYSYYKNKKELLEDVMSYFLWETSSSIRHVFPAKQGMEAYREAYLKMTRLIYRHRRLFRQLMKNDVFQGRMIDMSVSYLLMQYEDMLPDVPDDILRMTAVGTSSYVYGNLYEWARNGYLLTPEELTEKLILSLNVTKKRFVSEPPAPNKLD